MVRHLNFVLMKLKSKMLVAASFTLMVIKTCSHPRFQVWRDFEEEHLERYAWIRVSDIAWMSMSVLAWWCGKFPSHSSQGRRHQTVLGLAMLAKAINAPLVLLQV